MKADFDNLLTRGVSDILVRRDLESLLKAGKPLRIKHGVDPTRPDLHLGHAAIYRKLRKFQDLGHTIIFLIGDFTSRFGDPTDKLKTRTMQNKEAVAEAAESYIDQIGKILDKKKLEIRRNGEWYDKMSAEDLLRIMSRFTVSRMLERDMFVKRRKAGEEIGLHEPVYPVLQAYDSVMLKSDFTIVGTDQTFNELQARPLQESYGQKPQQVMSLQILVGTDGKKMSKTLGNDIKIMLAPEDMFGKLMSIPDSAMAQFAELLTDLPVTDFVKPKDPRAAKARLAFDIVAWLHGEKNAKAASEQFEKIFVKRETPKDVPSKKVKDVKTVTDMVAILFSVSKSEARRLILQNAIECDGVKVTDPTERPKEGMYKKGRHYMRATLK